VQVIPARNVLLLRIRIGQFLGQPPIDRGWCDSMCAQLCTDSSAAREKN